MDTSATDFPPSSSSMPTQAPSIDRTFGAILIGTFVAAGLYGVTLHQASRYFRVYGDDSLVCKAVAFTTVLLETAHTALSFHICYHYLVGGYGNPGLFPDAVWSIQALPILTGAIIAVSQGFFARRAYTFGCRYRIWVILATMLFIGELMFCIATTVVELAVTKKSYELFVPYTWIVTVASALSTAADIVLTAVLIISLHESRSGLKQSDSVVDVLILYAVATGLVTSVVMVLLLITSLAIPQDLIYTGISIVATKLYANALFAALNTRQALREKLTCPGPSQDGSSNLTMAFNRRPVHVSIHAANIDNHDMSHEMVVFSKPSPTTNQSYASVDVAL